MTVVMIMVAGLAVWIRNYEEVTKVIHGVTVEIQVKLGELKA